MLMVETAMVTGLVDRSNSSNSGNGTTRVKDKVKDDGGSYNTNGGGDDDDYYADEEDGAAQRKRRRIEG